MFAFALNHFDIKIHKVHLRFPNLLKMGSCVIALWRESPNIKGTGSPDGLGYCGPVWIG